MKDKNLEDYINSFFGFGNLNAPIWFIGKEEAGEAKDITSRVTGWVKLGRPNIADNYEFHSEFANQLGKSNKFKYLFRGKNANLQPTWNGLIKLQFAIEKGKFVSEEILKEFQSYKFGRKDSQNAILELFPLPSSNHNRHDYSKVSNLTYLENKKVYKTKITSSRIEYLKNKIIEKKPKFVVFYATSKEFIAYWKRIVNVTNLSWKRIKIEGRTKKNRYLLLSHNDTTTFCITQHTTYFGTSDEELLESGIKIKEFHESKIN